MIEQYWWTTYSAECQFICTHDIYICINSDGNNIPGHCFFLMGSDFVIMFLTCKSFASKDFSDFWFQKERVLEHCVSCKNLCPMCLCCIFFLGRLQLHVCDNLLSFSLALASPHPAGNMQPWVWNVFTFWVCYKLSAKTNFAWLGRSLHLAQMLFGSNVFLQGCTLILTVFIWQGFSKPDVNPGKS